VRGRAGGLDRRDLGAQRPSDRRASAPRAVPGRCQSAPHLDGGLPRDTRSGRIQRLAQMPTRCSAPGGGASWWVGPGRWRMPLFAGRAAVGYQALRAFRAAALELRAVQRSAARCPRAGTRASSNSGAAFACTSGPPCRSRGAHSFFRPRRPRRSQPSPSQPARVRLRQQQLEESPGPRIAHHRRVTAYRKTNLASFGGWPVSTPPRGGCARWRPTAASIGRGLARRAGGEIRTPR
jgi:hypothetical protein